MIRKRKKQELGFEDALSDDWASDLDVMEVPLDQKPLIYVGTIVLFLGLLIGARMIYLAYGQGEFYAARAEANLGKYETVAAPRGLIVDRTGKVLAENSSVWAATLDIKEFLGDKARQDETLNRIEDILGIASADVWGMIDERNAEESSEPVILSLDLAQNQVVELKALDIPALSVKSSFKREYPDGNINSSFIGYIGLASPGDLRKDPSLTGQDLVGKSGLEAYYNNTLRGTPGENVALRDAIGQVLDEQEKSAPTIGKTLNLTIDADLQKYFYQALKTKLAQLGRTSGAGLAIDPRTGEVLAYVNFPTYDNNIFSTTGKSAERKAVLTSGDKPMFNRLISGLYSPGSTIKPLVGVAALHEGVIDTTRTIFSPGYLDVPNPYDPANPTRFLDWQYQGDVDLYDAIAQSSDVYFYEVGGGAASDNIKGLGITALRSWWQKFGLDKPTGIDLPSENSGFLPSPDWKEKNSTRPWLLGDTYHVSIGQGDLTITPIELLDYICAIANGGKIYRPFLNKGSTPQADYDLTAYAKEITEVQKGMRRTVTSPRGTAFTMNDLPFQVAAKTGSAQVENNTQENAFFVGYAPYNDPKIAILVLVEHSKEGSLNAVPVAKDVLNWYYENRLKASK